jgi:hypothetical protein
MIRLGNYMSDMTYWQQLGLVIAHHTTLGWRVNRGTQFVVFSYAVSLVLVSLRRTSGVCVVAPGRSRFVTGLPYSVLSLLFGWWGIPHGPIFTVRSLVSNCRGGVDVTSQLAAAIRGQRLPAIAS